MHRKQRRQHELDEIAKELEDAKKPQEPQKPLRFLQKIEKPIPRPPTPSVKIPDQVRLHIYFHGLSNFYLSSTGLLVTLNSLRTIRTEN